jgi:protein-disulfide isomerase
MGKLEEWSMQAANSKLDLCDPISPADHVLGPENAPVFIVEYGDFECPTCKSANPVVKLLLRRFENHVRFAYRHFPLEAIHPHARLAAEAAECAGRQGKFWEMHDLLFANQPNLAPEHMRAYAKQLDLDTGHFESDLDGHVFRARVQADIDSGERSNLRATPGFFINGRVQDVSFSLHALLDATEATLRLG